MTEKDKVLEIFKTSDKQLRSGDIAKTIGIESKEVSKIIKVLREVRKVHSPKRWLLCAKVILKVKYR